MDKNKIKKSIEEQEVWLRQKDNYKKKKKSPTPIGPHRRTPHPEEKKKIKKMFQIIMEHNKSF